MQTDTNKSSALLKIKCLLVSLCMVLASITSSPVMSQGDDIDIEVPIIVQVQESVGIQGQPQSFTATVEDDQAVQSVTLYYRFIQSAEYTAEPMTQTADNRFEATVLTEDKNANSVQYYIKATDSSGNATFRGHAFSPKTVQLTPRPLAQSSEQNNVDSESAAVTDPAITQTSESKPVQSTRSGNRTLYTVLGVAAAVVLAGVAVNMNNDGGTDAGNTGTDGCSSTGCTVVFTSTEPTQ